MTPEDLQLVKARRGKTARHKARKKAVRRAAAGALLAAGVGSIYRNVSQGGTFDSKHPRGVGGRFRETPDQLRPAHLAPRLKRGAEPSVVSAPNRSISDRDFRKTYPHVTLELGGMNKVDQEAVRESFHVFAQRHPGTAKRMQFIRTEVQLPTRHKALGIAVANTQREGGVRFGVYLSPKIESGMRPEYRPAFMAHTVAELQRRGEPGAMAKILMTHELGHVLAYHGEAGKLGYGHRPTQGIPDRDFNARSLRRFGTTDQLELTERVVNRPSAPGLRQALGNATANHESWAKSSKTDRERDGHPAVSTYALTNPGEFFAENYAAKYHDTVDYRGTTIRLKRHLQVDEWIDHYQSWADIYDIEYGATRMSKTLAEDLEDGWVPITEGHPVPTAQSFAQNRQRRDAGAKSRAKRRYAALNDVAKTIDAGPLQPSELHVNSPLELALSVPRKKRKGRIAKKGPARYPKGHPKGGQFMPSSGTRGRGTSSRVRDQNRTNGPLGQQQTHGQRRTRKPFNEQEALRRTLRRVALYGAVATAAGNISRTGRGRSADFDDAGHLEWRVGFGERNRGVRAYRRPKGYNRKIYGRTTLVERPRWKVEMDNRGGMARAVYVQTPDPTRRFKRFDKSFAATLEVIAKHPGHGNQSSHGRRMGADPGRARVGRKPGGRTGRNRQGFDPAGRYTPHSARRTRRHTARNAALVAGVGLVAGAAAHEHRQGRRINELKGNIRRMQENAARREQPQRETVGNRRRRRSTNEEFRRIVEDLGDMPSWPED